MESDDENLINPDDISLDNESIGFGGQSDVYKAKHLVFGCVAIKYYKAGGKDYNNMLREIQILTKLKHKNIIKMFGYVNTSRKIGLVLELMDRNLRAVIRHPNIDINKEQVCSWFVQATDAFEYLHEQGVVHRDIKPENMVMNKDMTVLKVCDFGCTRNFGNISMTAGTIVGTSFYTAPEILNSKGTRDDAYGSPSDVYSFGKVIIETITFEEISFSLTTEQIDRALQQFVIEKQEVDDNMGVKGLNPVLCRSIILRSLRTNPKDRPKMKELNDFFASLGQKTLAELKNALAIEISLFSWENTSADDDFELVNKQSYLKEVIEKEELNSLITDISKSGVTEVKVDSEIRRQLPEWVTDYDYITLKDTIYGEARGEPEIGQIAVAHVILNRVLHSNYWRGSTIAGVCRHPWQFGCWTGRDRIVVSEHGPYASIDTWLPSVLNGKIPDPTGGCDHYSNPSWEKEAWIDNVESVIDIANHRFYRPNKLYKN